ncbi:hypothetical protein Tco_0620627 [Tanacetum coccineum]
MSSITAQQVKLDLELVPKEKRLEIRKCNGRLNPGKTQREPTFSNVPEVYIHQFWDSIHKHDTCYRFRMDKKKKFYLNLETFRDIFQICPRLHGQDYDELPIDEVIMSFFKELSHTREIKSITDVVPNLTLELVPKERKGWRLGKCNGKLHPGKTSEENLHFKLSLDASCFVNSMLSAFLTLADVPEFYHTNQFWDTIQQAMTLATRSEWTQRRNSTSIWKLSEISFRSALDYIVKTMMNFPLMKLLRQVKFKKHSSSNSRDWPKASPNEPTKKSKRVKRPAKKSLNTPTTGVVIRDTPGVSVSKKIAPAKADRGKGIELLSDAALIKETQLKKTLKKSKQETHKLQASGSSEGADFELEVPDESKAKSSDTNEGTCMKPGVPDVSNADSSKSDNESWGDSDDDNESDDNDDEGSCPLNKQQANLYTTQFLPPLSTEFVGVHHRFEPSFFGGYGSPSSSSLVMSRLVQSKLRKNWVVANIRCYLAKGPKNQACTNLRAKMH